MSRKLSRVAALRMIERICDRCVEGDSPLMMRIRRLVEHALGPYRRKGDDEIRLARGHDRSED